MKKSMAQFVSNGKPLTNYTILFINNNNPSTATFHRNEHP